jgi:hypothetical protein
MMEQESMPLFIQNPISRLILTMASDDPIIYI